MVKNMQKFKTKVKFGELMLEWYYVDEGETKIDIPDNISLLAKNCFKGHVECVTKINLSEKITALEDRIFNCFPNLTDIDIKNVDVVYTGTFSGCFNLAGIYSNKPVHFFPFSLFHCFSLISAWGRDKKEMVQAFGDTSIFIYPYFYDELEEAVLKIEDNLSDEADFEEYLRKWPENFLNRHVREIVLSRHGENGVAIKDTFSNHEELEELINLVLPLRDSLKDKPFYYLEPVIIPEICLYDDEVATFTHFMTKYGYNPDDDNQFVFGELNTVNDVVNHFVFMLIKDKIVDLSFDILNAEEDEEKASIAQNLEIAYRSYLDFLSGFAKNQHLDEYISLVDETLIPGIDILKKSFLDGSFQEKMHYSNVICLLSEKDEVACQKLEERVEKILNAKLFNIICKKDFGREIKNIEKYLDVSDFDLVTVYDFYSNSFYGHVNHVTFTQNGFDRTDANDLLKLMLDDRKNNLPTIVESLYENLLIQNLFLKQDYEELKKVREYFDIGQYSPFKKILNVEERGDKSNKLTYYFECNSLKEEGFSTASLLCDEKYKEAHKGALPYPSYLLVYDLENMILDHDFDSFEAFFYFVREDANFSLKDEQKLVLPTKAYKENGDESHILYAEGFNRIVKVKCHNKK